MNSVIFYAAFLGCFVLKTTYAVLGSSWTTPTIDTISGSGTVTAALAEDASTFPQPAASGATNYVISSQTPADTFDITAADGQLALGAGQALDYETSTTHVLVVTADDGTTTGTATITINIEDVNDNAPAFPSQGYSTCVADATAAAATVLTLATSDADAGSTTTDANVISAMTITAGNTNTDFAISTAGVLTTAKALDMSTTAGYSLTVEAADSDSGTKLTGTTTIHITVADSCTCGAGWLAASFVTLMLALVTSLMV